ASLTLQSLDLHDRLLESSEKCPSPHSPPWQALHGRVRALNPLRQRSLTYVSSNHALCPQRESASSTFSLTYRLSSSTTTRNVVGEDALRSGTRRWAAGVKFPLLRHPPYKRTFTPS